MNHAHVGYVVLATYEPKFSFFSIPQCKKVDVHCSSVIKTHDDFFLIIVEALAVLPMHVSVI